MRKPSHEYCKDCKDWNGRITNCFEICAITIDIMEEWEQYRAIGTVEECRENKEFLNFLYNRINPNDMEQYLLMYNCSDEKIN